MAASDAAPAAAAGGSSKQRRKKKKPAGSKWLNYLLGLGCLASLLPLWFEYHGKKQEPWVPQPHKDDPWVRVIDATAVEKEARRSGKVKTRYRHHPRHARMHLRVRADGSVAEEEEEDNDDGTADPVAVLHEEAEGADEAGEDDELETDSLGRAAAKALFAAGRRSTRANKSALRVNVDWHIGSANHSGAAAASPPAAAAPSASGPLRHAANGSHALPNITALSRTSSLSAAAAKELDSEFGKGTAATVNKVKSLEHLSKLGAHSMYYTPP